MTLEHRENGRVYYSSLRSTLYKLTMSLTLYLGTDDEYSLQTVNILVYIKSFEGAVVETDVDLPSVDMEIPIKTYEGPAHVSRGRVQFLVPIEGKYYL